MLLAEVLLWLGRLQPALQEQIAAMFARDPLEILTPQQLEVQPIGTFIRGDLVLEPFDFGIDLSRK